MKKVTLEEAQILFTNQQKYFVMFTTSWCPDCKMMKIQLKDIINEFKDKPITFIEIDAQQANLFRKNENGWQVLKVPAFFTVKQNHHYFIGYEYTPIPIIKDALLNVLK